MFFRQFICSDQNCIFNFNQGTIFSFFVHLCSFSKRFFNFFKRDFFFYIYPLYFAITSCLWFVVLSYLLSMDNKFLNIHKNKLIKLVMGLILCLIGFFILINSSRPLSNKFIGPLSEVYLINLKSTFFSGSSSFS